MKLHRAQLNTVDQASALKILLTPKSLLQPSSGLAPASLALSGTEKPRARHSTPGVSTPHSIY